AALTILTHTHRRTCMRVERINTWEELEAIRDDWNAVSGNMPLRSWDWLAAWWKFYGSISNNSRPAGDNPSQRELFVLAVYEESKPAGENAGGLVGIAPWYIDRSAIKGRVVRWLGDGEVCTDHSSLICAPANIDLVANAVASAAVERFDNWDA